MTDRWLILGQDEGVVQALQGELENGNGEVRKKGGWGGVSSVAAWGAIVGAVVTFTGLAFS